MEWLFVVMPILVGLVLVLLEILVIPGVGLAGIAGFLSLAGGVYLGYSFFGISMGHVILLLTFLLLGVAVFFALRSSSWKALGLRAELKDTVEGVDSSIKKGDVGVTMGRLAPMGNVSIGDMIVEAESKSGYIEGNKPVEVIKVLKNKVIVKMRLD